MSMAVTSEPITHPTKISTFATMLPPFGLVILCKDGQRFALVLLLPFRAFRFDKG